MSQVDIDDYFDMEKNNISDTLDDKWIQEFEQLEKDYHSFYKEDVNVISFQFVYMNRNKEIEFIKKEKIDMQESNRISKEHLVSILKDNKEIHNIQYSLDSMCKYNIKLNVDEITTYIRNPHNIEYLNVIHSLNDIVCEPTISMFQDLNTIYIFYIQRNSSKHTTTRKIIFKNLPKNKKGTRKNTFKKIN